MKPVGLTDPRTGRRPYAVVQLRQDNALGTLYNMVGFQTKLKHGEQVRDLPHDPRAWSRPSSRGSAACTATPSSTARACSTATLRLKAAPHLRFAGQITGVRGLRRERRDRPAGRPLRGRRALGEALAPPPPTTALGALLAPHHRRRRGRDLPADERQFRPVPAARARGKRANASRRWPGGRSPTSTPGWPRRPRRPDA